MSERMWQLYGLGVLGWALSFAISGLWAIAAADRGVTALSSASPMEPASGLHPDGLQSHIAGELP